MDYTNTSISSLIDSISQINPTSILYLGNNKQIIESIEKNDFNLINIDTKKLYENEFSTSVDVKNILPDNSPEKFELIITSNELEFISDDLCIDCIKKICDLTNNIILSIDNPHNSSKSLEFWSKIFAENNFIRNLAKSNILQYYKLSNINEISPIKIIEQYEKAINSLTIKVSDYNGLKRENQKNKYDKKYFYAINKDLKSDVDYLSLEVKKLKEKNLNLIRQNNIISNNFNAISNSRWWKFTKPGRIITENIKKIPGIGSLIIALRIIKNNGIKSLIEKIKYKKQLRKIIKKNSIIISQFLPAKMAVKQLNTTFENDITFSILVPLFNTPIPFLKEMIDSCINQTYQKWELCLADASTQEQGEVYKICQSYIKKDKRIKYKKIKNISISDNTNEAIKMATGNYISLLDHDDFLHPSALYENMLAITKKNADFIYTDEMTFGKDIYDPLVIHLKQDFAPDTLRANNYICHFSTFSRELLDKVGYFNPECNGSQDYDIILRLTEQAKSIVHIPKVLYYWRCHEGSVASDISVKPYCITAGVKALSNHLKRLGIKGQPEATPDCAGIYKINYEINESSIVSIIIPNKDSIEYLSVLIDSIIQKTTYKNYEIIIIENNSTENETFIYYDEIQKKYSNIKVFTWENEFNYSAINNYGVSFSNGDYLLFLNNDMKVISPNWIEEMLMFAQRQDVGTVGAKLYYQDDTIQHSGIFITLNSTDIIALHYHKGSPKNCLGYMGRLMYSHNVTAVTGACMLIRKSVFNKVGGFNIDFPVAFNDVDLCLKLRDLGYLNVFTPYAELYHYESKSRGDDHTNNTVNKRLKDDIIRFKKTWYKLMYKPDPYYNPNFKTSSEDFSIDVKPYSETQY